MRARLTSLLLATAWVAGGGCASKPAEDPSGAAMDRSCASAAPNSLHLTSSSDIDSILTQPTSDPRLAQINRRMYLSLRTLDAELRRQERLAACQQQSFEGATLQAQASDQSATGAGGGSAVAGQRVSGGQAANVTGAAGAIAVTGASSAVAPGPAPATYATSIRKTSLSANGGGGNGATAPKVVPGSDNDIVARRLRRAAEQETDPSLRAKLWKEYTEYRQGTSAK